jgi:hypothetical protein
VLFGGAAAAALAGLFYGLGVVYGSDVTRLPNSQDRSDELDGEECDHKRKKRKEYKITTQFLEVDQVDAGERTVLAYLGSVVVRVH